MFLKQHLEALERKNCLTFEVKGRGEAPVIVPAGLDDQDAPLVEVIAS